MSAPENPPAFPQSMTATPAGDVHWSGQAFPGADGMSLRDWFAGQALAGMLAAEKGDVPEMITIEGYARDAFRIADAMLAARKGGDQ